METKKFYGNKISVVAFLMMLACYGTSSAFAIFLPEFSRHIQTDPVIVATMASFFGIGGIIGNFLAGKMYEMWKLKYAIAFGCLTIFVGYVLYATSSSLVQYYIGATLIGLGSGYGALSGSAVMIQRWFIDKREELIGLSFAGAGLGACIAMFLCSKLIVAFNVQVSCWALGAFVLIMAIPALVVIKDPEELGQKPLGWEKYEEMIKKGGGHEEEIGVTWKEAIKSPALYIMAIAVLCVGMLMLGFETYAPEYWQSNGVSVTASANALCIYYLIGSVMTVVSGRIAQRIGLKAYIIYINVAFMIGAIFCIVWGNAQNFMIMGLIVVFMGIAYPLFTSVPATVTTATFGNKDYPKLCGFFNGIMLAGSLVYPIIIGAAITMAGSMVAAYILLAVMAAVAIILLLIGLNVSPYKKMLNEMGVKGK